MAGVQAHCPWPIEEFRLVGVRYPFSANAVPIIGEHELHRFSGKMDQNVTTNVVVYTETARITSTK